MQQSASAENPELQFVTSTKFTVDDYLNFDDVYGQDSDTPRRVDTPTVEGYPPFLDRSTAASQTSLPTVAPAAGPFLNNMFEFDNNLFAGMPSPRMEAIMATGGRMGDEGWSQPGWDGENITVSPFAVGGWSEQDSPNSPPESPHADDMETLEAGHVPEVSQMSNDDGPRSLINESSAESDEDNDSGVDAMSVSSFNVSTFGSSPMKVQAPTRAPSARRASVVARETRSNSISGRKNSIPIANIPNDQIQSWAEQIIQSGDTLDDVVETQHLAPKERRQLRNKVNARISRIRKKENVSRVDEDSELHKKENKILKQRLAEIEKENKALRKELGGLKKQLGALTLSESTSSQPTKPSKPTPTASPSPAIQPSTQDLRAAVDQRKQNLDTLLRRLTAPTNTQTIIAYNSSMPQVPSITASPSSTSAQTTSQPSTPVNFTSPAPQKVQKLQTPSSSFCNPNGTSGWSQNRVKVYTVGIPDTIVHDIEPEKKSAGHMRHVIGGGNEKKAKAGLASITKPMSAQKLIRLAGMLGGRAAESVKLGEVLGSGSADMDVIVKLLVILLLKYGVVQDLKS